MKNRPTKMPAANKRFGARAAVTHAKRLCELESLYPHASVVEAAPAPSRCLVSSNRAS